MSARRFKGYAVCDDEGRWLGHVDSDKGVVLGYGNKGARQLWEDAEDAQDAARHDVLSINGFVIVPVFSKPKPAPIVAAEGRYAVLSERGPRAGFQGWGPVSDEDFIGTREQAMRVALVYGTSVVRILPDGAYEAAVAAARREERERVLADLRDRFVLERDDAAIDAKERGEPDYVKGITWAIDVLDNKKGQAK